MGELATPSILLVEDELIVAMELEQNLTALGYRIVGNVSDYDGAVEAVREYKPDLVLMDIGLRGGDDGIKAAKHIRREYDIPVIFLTAHGDDGTISRARTVRPAGYLVKPYDVRELRAMLEVSLYKVRPELSDTQRPFDQADLELDEPARNISAHLARIPCFASLPPSERTLLAKQCILKHCRSNTILGFEGSDRKNPFLILNGRIVLSKTSSNGKEPIVEMLGSEDLLGLAPADSGLLDGVLIKAHTDTTLCFVPPQLLRRLQETFPVFSLALAESLSERLTAAHEFARALAHDSVELRIASMLLLLHHRFESIQETRRNRLHLTRQELSSLVGATLDTAIRITKRMEREGLLDLSRRGQIGIPSLEDLSNYAATL